MMPPWSPKVEENDLVTLLVGGESVHARTKGIAKKGPWCAWLLLNRDGARARCVGGVSFGGQDSRCARVTRRRRRRRAGGDGGADCRRVLLLLAHAVDMESQDAGNVVLRSVAAGGRHTRRCCGDWAAELAWPNRWAWRCPCCIPAVLQGRPCVSVMRPPGSTQFRTQLSTRTRRAPSHVVIRRTSPQLICKHVQLLVALASAQRYIIAHCARRSESTIDDPSVA